ncbi:MAG: hypothetical protein C4542_08070 [Dehalococcoidia bacterium]|nr:MAG: hypothetical protein C4542_08070 [Dehalococcoidia bacterium]
MADYKDKPLICIDFDGTIAQYDGWKGIGVFGEPLPGVAAALARLRDSFRYQICVFTTRGEVDAIRDYLKRNCIPFDYINDAPVMDGQNPGKPPAKYFIDDRAVRFEGSWTRVMRQIEELDEIEMTRNGAAYHVGITDEPAPELPTHACQCGCTTDEASGYVPRYAMKSYGYSLTKDKATGESTWKAIGEAPPVVVSEPESCWCGRELESKGSPDFIGDDVNTMPVCTMHYSCPVHGQYYDKPRGIAISGKARSGKSTLTDMLIKAFPSPSSWHEESIATPLKIEWFKTNCVERFAMGEVADIVSEVNRLKLSDPKVRPGLIVLGQMRRAQDPDYWLKQLPLGEGAIVSDCRFKNEFEYLQQHGFYMIRVNATADTRAARGQMDIDDSSETELDDPEIQWDKVIDNDSTFLVLADNADDVVRKVRRLG